MGFCIFLNFRAGDTGSVSIWILSALGGGIEGDFRAHGALGYSDWLGKVNDTLGDHSHTV